MEYILILVAAMVAITVWSKISEINHLKQLKLRLKREWGTTPTEEYSSEKLDSIKAYYSSVQDNHLDIDDITWNDLDMDEIYMEMNNTQSSIGEEYLYALLRKPCFSGEELAERNRLMKFFEDNEEARIELQARLHKMGKLRSISVFEYNNRLQAQEASSNLIHYLLDLGLLLSVALIFVNPGLGGIGTFAFVIVNIFHYYSCKVKIENYITVFAYLLRLLDSTNHIIKLDLPQIRDYTKQLKEDIKYFSKIKRGSFILAPKSVNGNLVDAVLDYLRMLFHLDLIKYNSMLSFFKKNRTVLNRIFEKIGYLDSMTAAASFRKLIYYYCEPELSRSGQPFLEAEDLYHPLLEQPVPNSISERRSVLLTGSNASGKSTFIKTLAINSILSQTIYTSTARSYRGSFFMIYSSMALRDNIFSNESYYIVEIKSLKRILDHVNGDIPMLCFIDEVLRGTNTLERIAASSRILHSLAGQNVMAFAATHDIELTHILEQSFSNYHFQERIEDKQVLFDYKLYQGKAVSKNAIRLLDMLGYPEDIITSAEQAAQDFLTGGEWKDL
jgi:DNA mismatch repair ATPase MutS